MQVTAQSSPADLEARLKRVEEQIATLLGGAPSKDWQSAVGMLTDDALSREIDELGRRWRESVKDIE